MSFGYILRSLREERRMTQQDLCGKGMSRVLISHYESGRRLPSFNHLQILAEKLGVSVDVFFDGIGTTTSTKNLVTLLEEVQQLMSRADLGREHLYALLDTASVVAQSHALTAWKNEILWMEFQVSRHHHDWPRTLRAGLRLILSDDFQLEQERKPAVLMGMGEAWLGLDDVYSAQAIYGMAQDLYSPSAQPWFEIMVRRASCHYFFGEIREASAIFAECSDLA